MAMFYAAYFAFMGIQLPFMPVWLEARGLDSGEIGVVLALAMAARPLVVPLATRIADRLGWLKGPLVAASFCTAAGFLLLGTVSGFPAILAVYGLASVFWAVILPFGDAFALRGLAVRQKAYGPVRLWGSVTFIVANLGGGVLLERLGAPNLVWALFATLSASALVTVFLVPAGAPPEAAEKKASRPGLWRSKVFVAVVVAGSLVQASHAVLYGFASLQWAAKGLDGFQIGGLWAIGVVAEVLLFAMSGRIAQKLGPLDLLVVGAMGAAVRWGVMAFDPPAIALPALQCLHGLSFGATHLAAMLFLQREQRGATAQGDYSSMVAVVSAAGMGMSGLLVEAGGSLAYLAMATPAAAGVGIALAARRAARPRPA